MAGKTIKINLIAGIYTISELMELFKFLNIIGCYGTFCYI